MFSLKGYQKRGVKTLEQFFTKVQELQNVEQAYSEILKEQKMPDLAYRDYGFDQVPYVCIRIPTGGGKTVLASYAVVTAARHYLEVEFPITLWLVPTNTIRQQTVDALKTPGHPYRDKLDQAFNYQVLVLDIDEVTQIRPQDIGNKAIVIVSTIANLRVNDTSGRKVYAYHENFEPHFAKVPDNHSSMDMLERVTEEDIKENGISNSEIGKVKYSFANLLALHRPLVIIDEAHNARTSLTFDTLKRVHPAAVIEFTATPNTSNTNGSNVLFHVSASELKSEEMIKLPIILTEHQNWQNAVRDAVLNRNRLAIDAQKDDDYIRPIVLLQAEPKNGKVTVDVLKEYLLEQLKVPENKLAIVTGKQRELDGINLFDTDCPIEYIITIEALKEGWDCSFAYVFCSVKQVSSSKDAEQLLGRVLRMPYAKRRVIEDLNRAYAHLSSTGFANAAKEITDKLIAMGFEELEVAAFLRHGEPTEGTGDLFDGSGDAKASTKASTPKSILLETSQVPDTSSLDDNEKSQITVTHEGEKVLVKVTGEVSDKLHKILIETTDKPATKKEIKTALNIHNHSIQADKSPAEQGQLFSSLPLLCAMIQDEFDLVEPESVLDTGQWSILNYPAKLASFRLEETTHSFTIDMDGKEITYHISEQNETFNLNEAFTDITEKDLIRWLDRELRQHDVIQREMIKFLSSIINDLLQTPNLTLTALVRNKFPLARAIRDLIRLYRRKAQKESYQKTLFGNDARVEVVDTFQYEFDAAHYPARPPFYQGRYKFSKHYYPIIEDLKSTGEEYECAKAIDSIPEVKYWIRNLVKRDHASFWLPLAHNKFYPDFVVELKDGRMLIVEYKGEAYVTNDDSAEKRNVGELWSDTSNDKCLFIMAVEQDKQGRDVRNQILSIINKELK